MNTATYTATNNVLGELMQARSFHLTRNYRPTSWGLQEKRVNYLKIATRTDFLVLYLLCVNFDFFLNEGLLKLINYRVASIYIKFNNSVILVMSEKKLRRLNAPLGQNFAFFACGLKRYKLFSKLIEKW